jgi:hypothetical protein
MMQVRRGMVVACALVGLCWGVPCNPLHAQEKPAAPDPVNIDTVDGVQLHGAFYQSPKAKAPTVIILHRIGDSALNKKAYISLAEALQPNYSVMLFDFRGHGKSKDVTPADFWKVPMNFKGIKGANPKKASIEYVEFNKSYYPALVNDIAAVKAHLDRRNDGGDCNTASTILIGAETGATLGAIWLNSQWSLTRMIPNPMNPIATGTPNKDPEGKDVIACVWLSMSSKLGEGTVSVSKTLESPVKTNNTYTVFIYGDKDTAGKGLATSWVKHLNPKADDKKHEFIKDYEIGGGAKLQGIELLQKGLTTQKDIVDYLDIVVDAKRREWTKRDFKTSDYVWRVNGALAPAKRAAGPMATDPNNLMFNEYGIFIGR